MARNKYNLFQDLINYAERQEWSLVYSSENKGQIPYCIISYQSPCIIEIIFIISS